MFNKNWILINNKDQGPFVEVSNEASLLGSLVACITEDGLGFKALEVDIRDDYFVTSEARFFFTIIKSLYENDHKQINWDLFVKLCYENSTQKNGLPQALAELSGAMTWTNPNFWAMRLVKDYCKREVDRLKRIDDEDVLDSILRYQDTIDRISKTDGLSSGQYRHIRSILHDLIEKLDEEKDVDDTLELGFENHNEVIVGKGHLVVVGARSGMGKTSYVCNLMRNMLMADKTIAMFSLEITAEEIARNILSIESGVAYKMIAPSQVENLSSDQIDNLFTASQNIHSKNLTIVDEPGLSLQEIERQSRMIARKVGGLDAIFIDNINLMSIEGKYNSVREKFIDITKGLKIFAKQMGLPIFIIAQTNRDADKRPDKRPHVSDLKESGSIEQDADSILFVYRPNYYDLKCDDDKTYIICRKNRHGERSNFEIPMQVNPSTRKFFEDK